MKLPVAVLLTTILLGAAVRAEPAPGEARDLVELDWAAPAGCPQAAEVEAMVAEIVGTETPTGTRLLATARLEAAENGTWIARLATARGGERGERELVGEDCAGVARAVALVLGMMLDPASEQAAAPPREGPEPAPPPPAPPEPAATPVAPPPRESPGGAYTRVQVALGTGVLPGWDAGGALHLGLAGRWVAAEFRLAGWLPRTATATGAPTAGSASDGAPQLGAELWMVTATPAGCGRVVPGGGPVRLETCLGLGVTSMSARGFGMERPSRVTVRWATSLAELGAALLFSERTSLRASAELSVPFLRPRFAVEYVGDVHQPAPIGFGAGLAAELGF